MKGCYRKHVLSFGTRSLVGEVVIFKPQGSMKVTVVLTDSETVKHLSDVNLLSAEADEDTEKSVI